MTQRRTHPVIIGLSWGDEGKGSVIDYLVRERNAHAVVRHNGGAQAAHNVVLPDGRHHTFAQFGSGTFVPNTKTHLSRFMCVNPLNLLEENEHLMSVGVSNALDLLSIDEQALVTTPIHMAANQAREIARGLDRHGSCGQGVGETAGFAALNSHGALRIGDFKSVDRVRTKLRTLVAYYESYGFRFEAINVDAILEQLCEAACQIDVVPGEYLGELLRNGTCVFEGAQGALLDETHGFPPHNTWSNCTFANAETLLREHGHESERVGVLRTYSTRHGAGPFPVDMFYRDHFPETHNAQNEWQGDWRVGYFDTVAAEYANGVVGGCDWIALTHMDACEPDGSTRVHDNYTEKDVKKAVISLFHLYGEDKGEQRTQLLRRSVAGPHFEADIVEHVERHLDTDVRLLSYGPTHEDKRELAPAITVIEEAL